MIETVTDEYVRWADSDDEKYGVIEARGVPWSPTHDAASLKITVREQKVQLTIMIDELEELLKRVKAQAVAKRLRRGLQDAS